MLVLATSKFRVKNYEEFLEDPEVQAFVSYVKERGFVHQKDGYVAFWWSEPYPGTYTPVIHGVNENGDATEFNLLNAIERHILPGDVCRMQISGEEHIHAIGGTLWLVSSRGIVEYDAYTSWEVAETAESVRDDIRTLWEQVSEITEV